MVVRFGASYGVTTEYAMYPQAHRIHCLVLVPNKYRGQLKTAAPAGVDSDESGNYSGNLFALANTSFRYVEPRHPKVDTMASWVGWDRDSAKIPVRDRQEKLELNLEQFNDDTTLGVDAGTLNLLWNDYNTWNFQAFSATLGCRNGPKCGATAVAWAEMPRIALRAAWSFTRIDLPLSPSVSQTRMLAFDDGQKICVSLPGATVSADTGCWMANPNVPPFSNFWLLPDSTATSADASALQLEFRSLGTLDAKLPATYPMDLKYDRSCLGNTVGQVDFQVQVMKIIKPPAAKPTSASGAGASLQAAATKAAAAAKTADAASTAAAKAASATQAKLTEATKTLSNTNAVGLKAAQQAYQAANAANTAAAAAARKAKTDATAADKAATAAAAKAKASPAPSAAAKTPSYGCAAMLSDNGGS
jgi:hypothetical protein